LALHLGGCVGDGFAAWRVLREPAGTRCEQLIDGIRSQHMAGLAMTVPAGAVLNHRPAEPETLLRKARLRSPMLLRRTLATRGGVHEAWIDNPCSTIQFLEALDGRALPASESASTFGRASRSGAMADPSSTGRGHAVAMVGDVENDALRFPTLRVLFELDLPR
jgi:hypothetical protein